MPYGWGHCHHVLILSNPPLSDPVYTSSFFASWVAGFYFNRAFLNKYAGVNALKKVVFHAF